MTDTPPLPAHDTGGALVLLVSLAVGGVAGGLGVWFATRPDLPPEPPPVVEVVRPYSPEELEVVCLPYMRKTATTLEEAQTRVSALELRIRAKEQEIARLEGVQDVSKGGASDLGQRLAQAREQLSTLEQELADALMEKVGLLADLEETREALSGTRIELAESEARVVEAREEALDQRWKTFVQDAQLRVCNSGNPAKVAACRELVAVRMNKHVRRYKDCVRSGQAIPEVREARRTEQVPEAFSAYLDTDDRDLRGWYVYFCDPDLPEARQVVGGDDGLD